MWVEVKAVETDNDGDGQKNRVKSSTQQNRNLFSILSESLSLSLSELFVLLSLLRPCLQAFIFNGFYNTKLVFSLKLCPFFLIR